MKGNKKEFEKYLVIRRLKQCYHIVFKDYFPVESFLSKFGSSLNYFPESIFIYNKDIWFLIL